MQVFADHRFHSPLRELVVEASLSLAKLDAERLEELAVSCRALNCDLDVLSDAQRAELKRQAREASGEMAVFGRVLDTTRANLEVMDRLRDRDRGTREYGIGVSRASSGPWAMPENHYGHN